MKEILKGVLAGVAALFLALILTLALVLTVATFAMLLFTIENVSWLAAPSGRPLTLAGFCITFLMFLIAGYAAAASCERRKVLVGFLAGCGIQLLWSVLLVLIAVALALTDTAPVKLWLASRSTAAWIVIGTAYTIIGGLVMGGVAMLGAILHGALARRNLDARLRKASRKFAAYAALFSGLSIISLAALLAILYPAKLKSAELLNLSGLTLLAAILVVYAVFRLPRLCGNVKGMLRAPALYVVLAIILVQAITVIVRDRVNRPDPDELIAVMDEINAFHAIPEEKNGAIAFRKILNLIDKGDFFAVGEDCTHPWKASEHPEWAAWIQENQSLLDAAVEAAGYEEIYFTLGLSDHYLGHNTEILPLARCLARMMRFAALGRFGEGDVAGGLEYFNVAFQLAEGTVKRGEIDILVAAVMRDMQVTAIATILQETELSEDDLLLISKQLERWSEPQFPDPDAWAQAAKLQAAQHAVEFLRDMREEGAFSYFAVLCLRRDWFGSITNDVWETLLKEQTVEAMWQKSRECGGDIVAELNSDSSIAPFDKNRKMLDGMLFSTTEGILEAILKHRARLAVLQAYSAACRFQMSTGALPSGWDDLVPGYLPEQPADPFSDEPLRMARTEGILRVYSVGPDSTDKGGEGSFFGRAPDILAPVPDDDICLELKNTQ